MKKTTMLILTPRQEPCQLFDENFYPLQQRASPAYPPITQLTRH